MSLMMQRPPTKYARSGEAMIAYQVVGEGPLDLIGIGGPASHLDLQWDDPSTVRAFERYASFSRFVRFDRRGTGLSDPLDGLPTLEQQMDDLRAVMEAVGIERTALLGAVDAGLAALYAATHPDQVTALVLSGIAAGAPPLLVGERGDELMEIIESDWGQGQFLSLFAPSRVGDRAFEEWWARYERACVNPATARKIMELNRQTDLREVLPAIRVPTLMIHQTDNQLTPIELGREAAGLIPHARFVEVPGTDPYGWGVDESSGIDQIEEFLTGRRPQREPERVLATVLFTDIVGSTDLPRRWAIARGGSCWTGTTSWSATSSGCGGVGR